MALATPEDVRIRRQAASLSDAETAAAEALLELASGIVLEEASREEDWFDTLDAESKPARILKGLTIELVCRGMANPRGLERFSETLGAYSYSEGYRTAASGTAMSLATHEQLLIRRVVHGANSASAEQCSDVIDAAQRAERERFEVS